MSPPPAFLWSSYCCTGRAEEAKGSLTHRVLWSTLKPLIAGSLGKKKEIQKKKNQDTHVWVMAEWLIRNVLNVSSWIFLHLSIYRRPSDNCVFVRPWHYIVIKDCCLIWYFCILPPLCSSFLCLISSWQRIERSGSTGWGHRGGIVLWALHPRSNYGSEARPFLLLCEGLVEAECVGQGGGRGSISIGPAVVLSRLALNYSSVWLVLLRPGESRRATNMECLTQKAPWKKKKTKFFFCSCSTHFYFFCGKSMTTEGILIF